MKELRPITAYNARAFFNEGPNRFESYSPGDKLVPSTLNPIKVLLAIDPCEGMTEEEERLFTAMGVAEATFYKLNKDDRPNGRTERSLSVGDVVSVEFPDGRLFVMACESVGFKEVENCGL